MSLKQGWCGRCGWYPRLEIFLELDPWEREPAPSDKTEKKNEKIEVLRKLIAPWGWKMIGGLLLVMALTIAARTFLPRHGSYRFAWTLAQMIIGGVVFLGAHLSCYLFAAMENDRLSPLDIIAKPFSIWAEVALSLPATFWRAALAVWGLATLCCALTIGGFANRDLMDWGGQPARVSLVKAISQQAGDFNSLEEAIEATAKQEDVPATSSSSTQPLQMVDCLIIGYEPSGNKDFSTLVLAAEVGGKLRFVGTVSQGIPEDVRDTLNKRMRKLEQAAPFVSCSVPATWLTPTLTCRVSVKELSASNRLVRPVFKSLLNEVSVSVR